MGGLLSSLIGWISGNPSKVGTAPQPATEETNSDSPLSSEEAEILNTTWAYVKTDFKTHGIRFFILLFETHPHLQPLFKGFGGLPISDLIYSKLLAAHGTTIMSTIDGYIRNLDDVSVVVEMLKILGEKHHERGIKKEDFALAYPVLLQYLSEALGPAWSDEAHLAWKHLLEVVHSVISLAYDQ